jgi:hypothetical protein
MASRRSHAVGSDKARRAVSEFRKIQPTLTAFARVLTQNQKVRIIASTGVPHTDGKDIFIQPPIELGNQHQHDRAVCDRRNWTTMQQECPACAVREEVMATTYHEISHIAFESFSPPDASQLKTALAYVRQVSKPKQAERIIRRITESTEIPKNYMALASVINPYFKLLANSLEDVRINARMHKARPGTKPMMDAQILRVMSGGVAKHDGTVALWTDMHLNHQASIGAYLLASGFEPESGWLADEVIAALKDEQLRDILVLIPETADAHEAFTMSWEVFTRLRELGFYQLKEEEQDEDDESDEEEQPEPPKPPTPPTPPQPQQDSEEQDNSDDEASSDGGSSAGDSSDMEPEDDSDDSEDEDDESSEEDDGPEADDAGEPSGEEGEDGGSSDDSDEESDGDESGDEETEGSSDEGDVEESGEEQSDSSADESTEAGEDEDTQSDGDSEGEPESDEAGEAEAGDGGDDDAATGSGGSDSSATDASDDGGDEPSDSGGPDESSDDDGDGPPFLVEPDEEAEDEELDLGDLGLHQHHEETTPQDEKAIEVAIVQDEYFEKPSTTINGVKEWWYKTAETDALNRPYHAWSGAQLDARMRRALNGDFELPNEQVMGPALMKMRLVFAENKRTQRNRNQRSGRLQTRALGKRAPFGDDRLFGKKVVPAKRDYIVLIFLDVSGSTAMGGGGKANIQLIKEAAMGQAELCARTGVPFEVLAHTGAPATASEMTGWDATDKNLWLDIYHIKDEDEPWDDKAKQRLMDIGPSYYNLDGHTLEYARRRVEQSRATDKVILYYSDGKMPLENYYEELEILQREIATCKQRGITLLGVGIRTDSPAQHGLDTVQVDDSSDIGRVVQHLERRLVA